jgi:hypothetical protein
MRALFTTLLLTPILIILSVSFPVGAQDSGTLKKDFEASQARNGSGIKVVSTDGMYNQIFMPVGDYGTLYGVPAWRTLRSWSFSPIPEAWPGAMEMIEPGIYYDRNISFYLLRSKFKYSYLPLFGLHSSRFYRTVILALTPDNKYAFTIFSNLVLNKVQFRSDYILFDFEGKITSNLTYNINFDLDTEGMYVDPVRLIDLNYSLIPDSTFTLHYHFD